MKTGSPLLRQGQGCSRDQRSPFLWWPWHRASASPGVRPSRKNVV